MSAANNPEAVTAILTSAEKAEAENERLRSLIREGCDLLADEVDGLKTSTSIIKHGDEYRLSSDPEDAHVVAIINALEGWIGRAGSAALERKEGET